MPGNMPIEQFDTGGGERGQLWIVRDVDDGLLLLLGV